MIIITAHSDYVNEVKFALWIQYVLRMWNTDDRRLYYWIQFAVNLTRHMAGFKFTMIIVMKCLSSSCQTFRFKPIRTGTLRHIQKDGKCIQVGIFAGVGILLICPIQMQPQSGVRKSDSQSDCWFFPCLYDEIARKFQQHFVCTWIHQVRRTDGRLNCCHMHDSVRWKDRGLFLAACQINESAAATVNVTWWP